MKEFNPTPGPWEVQHGVNVMKGNRSVASCGGYSSNTADPEEQYNEHISNARLIAAAPTMYQKLKDTVEWLDREIEAYASDEIAWISVTDAYVPEWVLNSRNSRRCLEELRDDLIVTIRKIEGGE